MASSSLSFLFSLLLLSVFSSLLLVKSDSEEDNLFQGINSYRTSLNLSTLTKNTNAECLAKELADQFKDQPCTNTTGANTVPGTEPQLSTFPNLLAKCHLNVSVTRDGVVMPACVPNLVPSLVLANFTESQYSASLNDSTYTGIGIGSEDNWIVVILTTSTADGGYTPATATDNAAGVIPKTGLVYYLTFMLVGSLFLL